MKRAFLLGAAALPFLLAACDVGPDYLKPENLLPKLWRDAPPEARPDWPSASWWTGFGSARLDQLMAEAIKSNYDLAQAAARVRQADAQVKIAGAPLLPQIGFNGDADRSRNPLSPRPANSHPVAANSYQGAFGASYELDFWGANRDARMAAEASAEASRYARQVTEISLEADVATSYFGVLALAERIRVGEANLKAATDILDGIKARLQVGTASALDVAEEESLVESQRAALAPLRQQWRQTGNALAILLAHMPETFDMGTERLADATIPPVIAGLPSGLLERRPDVQQAESNLIAAHAVAKQALASIFPAVTLTAQGGVANTALSQLFTPTGVLYALAASLSQPIFAGGALEGGIELEKARLDELRLAYQSAVINAFADAENALVAAEMTTRQEEAQKRARDVAEQAYDIAKAQFDNGTIDILSLLNTQRTLFQAQDQLVQARLAHIQAAVGLFKALGGGWSKA